MAIDWFGEIARAAAGGVIGGAVALGGQAVARRWTKKDERAKRAEINSEEAAKDIQELLSRIRAEYEHRFSYDDIPSYQEMRPYVGPIRTATQRILDVEARRRVDLATTALGSLSTLAEWGAGYPGQIINNVCIEAGDTLGALLRGEPLPADIEELEGYKTMLEEAWDTYRQAYEADEKRRRGDTKDAD